MTYLYIAIALLLALHLIPVLAIAALKLASRGYGAAMAEIAELPDVDATTRAAMLTCMKAARNAEDTTLWFDALAPVVTAYALLFTPRSANAFSQAFSPWNNNVSLNGDSAGVLRGGQWLQKKDIGTDALRPGESWVSYDDPAYGGDAYYARGHHPRSWFARWVWVGWRNRASQLSVSLGAAVFDRPVCISGSVSASRTNPGYFILRAGNLYQYRSYLQIKLLGKPVATLIRNLGAKLEYAYYSPTGTTAHVPYVVIGRSFKGA